MRRALRRASATYVQEIGEPFILGQRFVEDNIDAKKKIMGMNRGSGCLARDRGRL